MTEHDEAPFWDKFASVFLVLVWGFILLACGTPDPVFAQDSNRGCVSIERKDRPIQGMLDLASMHDAFVTGGPVIWWRPLSHQIMAILKAETGSYPLIRYRAIVVTERHDENSTLMSVYLLSVNLDQMCFAGDFPVQRYWDWREALVGRPA